MKACFRINGTQIKTPHNFKTEYYNVTTMTRIASGDMVGDLLGKKRKFYFTYNAISSLELKVILDAIWETNEIFYTLSYIEDNVEKSATVYVGSIPKELFKTGESWTWKAFTFNLIEK